MSDALSVDSYKPQSNQGMNATSNSGWKDALTIAAMLGFAAAIIALRLWPWVM